MTGATLVILLRLEQFICKYRRITIRRVETNKQVCLDGGFCVRLTVNLISAGTHVGVFVWPRSPCLGNRMPYVSIGSVSVTVQDSHFLLR